MAEPKCQWCQQTFLSPTNDDGEIYDFFTGKFVGENEPAVCAHCAHLAWQSISWKVRDAVQNSPPELREAAVIAAAKRWLQENLHTDDIDPDHKMVEDITGKKVPSDLFYRMWSGGLPGYYVAVYVSYAHTGGHTDALYAAYAGDEKVLFELLTLVSPPGEMGPYLPRYLYCDEENFRSEVFHLSEADGGQPLFFHRADKARPRFMRLLWNDIASDVEGVSLQEPHLTLANISVPREPGDDDFVTCWQ